MLKSLYLMTPEDLEVPGVESILTRLGGVCLSVVESQPLALETEGKSDCTIMGVFIPNGGHFRSNHVRFFASVAVARARTFPMPDTLAQCLDGTDIPLLAVKRSSIGLIGFGKALWSAHYRDARGAWTGPKHEWIAPELPVLESSIPRRYTGLRVQSHA